jgi:ribose transport system substrate-binding protein/inositol transport system substrate-binding protein
MKLLSRRSFAALLVVAASATVAISSMTGAGAATTKKVCLLANSTTSPYAALLNPAIVTEGAKLGLSVQTLDGNSDIATQAQQMDDCIAEKVAGVVVVPVDAKGIVPALARAAAAGIPIENSNAEVDPSGVKYIKAFTGPGDYEMALLAGKTLGKDLKGAAANIAEIQGSAGYGPTIARAAGFAAGLKATDPKAKIIAQEDGNWVQQTAQTDAAALIAKYGKKINYFYCHDDTMCVGAAAAIKSSGLPIHIVSLTLNKQGAALIKSGVFLFSVLQSPQTDGDLAAQTMAKILKGQSVPKVTYITTPLVTKANLSKYPAPF